MSRTRAHADVGATQVVGRGTPNAIEGQGTGSGNGVYGVGGPSGGAGGYFVGDGGAQGCYGEGQGGGAGHQGVGGASDGNGGEFFGGATNGGGVYGEGAGTGIGVYGFGVNGYGVKAQSDTSSPVCAAFRIVPQDAAPTGPNLVGDIYVTTGGVLKICTSAGTPGTWTTVGTQT
jgi:hypothetical protein